MKKRNRKPRGTTGGNGAPWDTTGGQGSNANNLISLCHYYQGSRGFSPIRLALGVLTYSVQKTGDPGPHHHHPPARGHPGALGGPLAALPCPALLCFVSVVLCGGFSFAFDFLCLCCAVLCFGSAWIFALRCVALRCFLCFAFLGSAWPLLCAALLCVGFALLMFAVLSFAFLCLCLDWLLLCFAVIWLRFPLLFFAFAVLCFCCALPRGKPIITIIIIS